MKIMYSYFARILFFINFIFLSTFCVSAFCKDKPPLADHFFVVLKDSDYQALAHSSLLKELGFLEFHKTVSIGERHWTGTYLSGESFYIEFFSDKTEVRQMEPQDLLAHSGLGFVADYGSLIEKVPEAFPEADSQRVLKALSGANGNYAHFAVSKELMFWVYEAPLKENKKPKTRAQQILDLRARTKDPFKGAYPLDDLEILQLKLSADTHTDCATSFKQMGFSSKPSTNGVQYTGTGGQRLVVTEGNTGPFGIQKATFSLKGGNLNWPVGVEKSVGSLKFKRLSPTQLEITFF